MKNLTWSLWENIKRCKGSWRALGLDVGMNGTNIRQYFYYITILIFGYIEIQKKITFEFLKSIFKVSVIPFYILKWKNRNFNVIRKLNNESNKILKLYTCVHCNEFHYEFRLLHIKVIMHKIKNTFVFIFFAITSLVTTWGGDWMVKGIGLWLRR